jgi:hypothetical protein
VNAGTKTATKNGKDIEITPVRIAGRNTALF